MQTSSLSRRVVKSGIDLRALVVDCAVIVGLVGFGMLIHRQNPIGDVLYTIDAVAPFVAGWLLCSTLIGLYRNRTRETITAHLRSVAVCWLAAANVAFLLRGSPIVAGSVEWPFPLVMTGLGLLVLLGSRTAYDWRYLRDENRL